MFRKKIKLLIIKNCCKVITWVWLLALMDPLEDPHPEAGGYFVVPAVTHFPPAIQQVRGELHSLVQVDVLRFILESEYN